MTNPRGSVRRIVLEALQDDGPCTVAYVGAFLMERAIIQPERAMRYFRYRVLRGEIKPDWPLDRALQTGATLAAWGYLNRYHQSGHIVRVGEGLWDIAGREKGTAP